MQTRGVMPLWEEYKVVRSVGKNYLLQASGIPGAGANWTTLGDLQSNGMTINNSEVDISTKDSGGFRELMPEGVVTSVEMNAEGVFSSNTATRFVRDAALYGHRVTVGSYDQKLQERMHGSFQISNFSETGPNEGPTGFSCTFSSDGIVVIASGVGLT